jgi:hypothetical protein
MSILSLGNFSEQNTPILLIEIKHSTI